jgi:rare lipoprotein A (peptidoglycan hydrolase)
MTAQRRPPWDVDPKYVDPEDTFEYMERVDPRDVETREEAGNAGRLFATILAIVVVFAIAFFIATKLAEGAALRGADVTSQPAAGRDRPLPGAPRAPVGANRPAVPESSANSSGASSVDVVVAGSRWSGTATWYCGSGSPCTAGYGPSDLVAAIDRSLGIGKGELVVVRSQASDRRVIVRIVDVCACGGARLIDLTTGAFSRLAPLGYGVLPVTLEVIGSGPRPTLPPTDASLQSYAGPTAHVAGLPGQ